MMAIDCAAEKLNFFQDKLSIYLSTDSLYVVSASLHTCVRRPQETRPLITQLRLPRTALDVRRQVRSWSGAHQ